MMSSVLLAIGFDSARFTIDVIWDSYRAERLSVGLYSAIDFASKTFVSGGRALALDFTLWPMEEVKVKAACEGRFERYVWLAFITTLSSYSPSILVFSLSACALSSASLAWSIKLERTSDSSDIVSLSFPSTAFPAIRMAVRGSIISTFKSRRSR